MAVKKGRKTPTRSAPPKKYGKKDVSDRRGKRLSYQDILDTQPIIERPKEDINAETVEKLASYGCTYDDIAEFFNVAPSFIAQYFKQNVITGRANLKMSLRMTIVGKAMEGNVAALLHLSKHYLNMTDQLEVTVHKESDAPKLSDDELMEHFVSLDKLITKVNE